MKLSRLLLAGTAACAMAAASPAHATIATLFATYDLFSGDTIFTVDNLSADTLTGVTLTTTLGPDSISLPDLSPGTSEDYSFAEPSGGFTVSPDVAGTPDTTLYQFSVTAGGETLASHPFSPVANLTGAYVDFLGNTCHGFDFCGVAEGGLVAAVPEPATLALLGAGLIGVAASRRRRA